MDKGLIRDGDAELVAQAILGVTTSLARHEVLTGRRSAGEVADAAVSFCLEGLGASRREGAGLNGAERAAGPGGSAQPGEGPAQVPHGLVGALLVLDEGEAHEPVAARDRSRRRARRPRCASCTSIEANSTEPMSR